MLPDAPATDVFKEQLRKSLELETRDSRTIRFRKHSNVYTCGDKSKSVYYIQSGQIKLLMLSPVGKECLLAIYSAGDVFGEMCLAGRAKRQETAEAMEETLVKQIPCSRFFSRLTEDSILEGFVRYLAVRISAQQEVINNLVTEDSEHRLGRTLLQLAKKLGRQDPRSIIIEHKISHEELSEMVGATRPWISKLMRRFRELDLIEISERHFIIVKQKRLTGYLNRSHSKNSSRHESIRTLY